MSTTDTAPAPSPRFSMLPSAPLPAGRRPRRAFLRRAARRAGRIARRFTLDAVEIAAVAAFTVVAFLSVAIVFSGGPS